MPDERNLPQAREDQFLGASSGLPLATRWAAACGLTADEVSRQVRPARRRTDCASTMMSPGSRSRGDFGQVRDHALHRRVDDDERWHARSRKHQRPPRISWFEDRPGTGCRMRQSRASSWRPHGDGLVPDDCQPPSELAVAVRGVPVGLLHAVGGYDQAIMASDAGAGLPAQSRIGGAGRRQPRGIVARAMPPNAGTAIAPDRAPGASGLTVPTSLRHRAGDLSTMPQRSPMRCRPRSALVATDSLGALGRRDRRGQVRGASGIPQHLIDGLDARIYLTLAAPVVLPTAARACRHRDRPRAWIPRLNRTIGTLGARVPTHLSVTVYPAVELASR